MKSPPFLMPIYWQLLHNIMEGIVYKGLHLVHAMSKYDVEVEKPTELSNRI